MGKPRLYYLLVEVDGEYAGHLTTTTAMLGHYLDSENIFFCQIENSQNWALTFYLVRPRMAIESYLIILKYQCSM